MNIESEKRGMKKVISLKLEIAIVLKMHVMEVKLL